MSVHEQLPLLPSTSNADCGHDHARRTRLNVADGTPAERLGNYAWWCEVCGHVYWGKA